MAATQLSWRTSLWISRAGGGALYRPGRVSPAAARSNADCSPSALQVPIVCTKEGLWTEEFKLCESLRGTCLPLPELNFVEYKCEEGHGIGKGRQKLNRKPDPVLTQPSLRAESHNDSLSRTSPH